ncbi:MAG: pyridoxamine 5'-phosphate oxidase family protein [Nitrosopumilus sp.]|nr:pyridoxamine 5'-phosphate oxidase family protein [Nitrosopumilus sp.]CAI9832727.1 Pyridoxamine 5'-phosphate oxidase family protein [Nitrosopumilaceae archaeon]MDA7940710.1 pyridoxamine 5'-phosphate oxidase family protein [Nitrosopumilus sp.]MDA7942918.1 pyridoxamine 5'-phosphate oxidase family protein [Nitrosopumilus sp.]MDA7944671.1 pyridoxamine 5'-phosphate oxidase family protein [Nitrosopumilus sp.]
MSPVDGEAARLVWSHRLCFVATASRGGVPNVSPKGTLVPLDGSTLAFAEIRSPDTVRNILENPRVEISVVDPASRRGYLFTGTASVVDDPGLVSLYRAAGVRSRVRRVVLVDVESAEPVLSPLYDLGMTEEQVRARAASPG